MGLLSNEYYEALSKQTSYAAPIPAPEKANAAVENIVSKATEGFDPYKSFVQSAPRPLVTPGINITPETPVRVGGDISEEEQIKRFGGPVGSAEYYAFKAQQFSDPFTVKTGLSGFAQPGIGVPGVFSARVKGPFLRQIGYSFGMKFPDEETWDKMSRYDQASHVGFTSLVAGLYMLKDLPRQVVLAPIRFGESLIRPWVSWAQTGQLPTMEQLGREEVRQLPWLGAVPTYWQTYQQAKDSGVGNLAATLMTSGLALGDVVIAGSLAEALTRGFQPRTAIKEGEAIQNTGPIKSALVKEQGKMKGINKRESSSEYYPLPRSTAKSLGGGTNDTFLKLTPAAADSIAVEVVQVRSGVIPKTIDYVRGKFGNSVSTYAGDFGPEIKLQSQVVRLPKTAEATAAKTAPLVEGVSALDNLKTELQVLDETIREHPAFSLTEFATNQKRELPEVLGATETARGKAVGEYGKRGDQIITELGFNDPEAAAKAYEELVKLRDQRKALSERIAQEKINAPIAEDKALAQASLDKSIELEAQIQTSLNRISDAAIKAIPPTALKGFERAAITKNQVSNLNLIAKVNGLDSGIQEAVIRTITGKNVVGELTQAEYIETAQALSLMNNMQKYAPDLPGVNIFAQYGSPQRNWMRTYEEKSGIPLYSEAYVPMEEAIRLRDAFRDSYRNQAREIYGRYAEQGFYEERRLIKNYMEGNKDAILQNPSLSQTTKNDLVKIADEMRPLYDALGVQFGIPTEVFLKDYQPHIAELGGVFQLYKQGQAIPDELSFFADFKRQGSLSIQADDSLALFDIYTNAGSNKLFLNPALERVAKLGESLPQTLQGSLRSYIQEKMGYAGKLEEFLNNVGQNINKRLGTNLPPDVARQVTQLIMDTTYAGGMGLNPGTVMRNGLQYDLLTYPRLGPDFYADALKTALTKEGMAEVRDAGFLVSLGVPYGAELSQDITLFGRVGNLYRKGTQATLEPFSMVESLNRARTYWQVKYQFNDALAKYNTGKLTWQQLEDRLDFDALSPVDRNIIRQRLISGDMKGAFENLAREVIDETQFPYRRGASSRITYGLTGRLGTQFGQWNIEFVHTLGRWVKTGQWDKLIRFAASSYAVRRSLSDALNFDFTRSVGAGPFNPGLAPMLQTGVDIVGWIGAAQSGNAEELQNNADNIARTMKSLGIPAGVEIQKWKSFFDSYNRGPVGPGGQYGVYDQRGRLQYWTTFDDIFWQAFGFPTNHKEAFRRQQSDLRNAKFEYSQAKQHVLELYQQEKYDEANAIINQYGIKLSPQDFDAYYIPFTDRTFQSLPPALKAEFAPRLYPSQ